MSFLSLLSLLQSNCREGPSSELKAARNMLCRKPAGRAEKKKVEAEGAPCS